MNSPPNLFGRCIIGQGRLVLALATIFALAGVAAYFQMSRQEDPSFPYRVGIITVTLPGASPGRMERLIARPLERQLAEVSQVHHIDTTLRRGVGIFIVQLGEKIYDTDTAWDRVRVAMGRAARDYPDGVQTAKLDDRIIDASLMVLAVTGDDNLRALAGKTKALRRRLLGVDGVASTHLFGDPGRQITIAIDDAAMSRNDLSPAMIARDMHASNQVTAGGTIQLAGASMNLEPATDFTSIRQIGSTAIGLPNGGSLPLSALADIHEDNASPGAAQLWYDGDRGIGLEIVAQRGVNTVALGERLRHVVARYASTMAPAHVHEMFYQPDQTQARLHNLSFNLLGSIAIILAVLFVFMGLRMGLVVAVLLPLVTLSTLMLYALGGGILQQIAVIGLVVSLGILVDNAIVMSENVQWRLNAGQSPDTAAAGSISELAGPLFAATGTTLAAFVPMLLSTGNTADFTRALPIMIMISLSVSYLFAITVTPIVCRYYLRPRPRASRGVLDHLGDGLSRWTVGAPKRLIAGGALAIALSLACGPLLDQSFFPAADRDVVVVDLSMPEGTAIDHTSTTARQLAQALRSHAEVRSVDAFIGNGGPTFYYNLRRASSAPQFGRVVVNTTDKTHNADVIDFVERYSHRHLPGAEVVARSLGQGPIVNAPIEVRVFNPDAEARVAATDAVSAAARKVAGTREVRNDLGRGVPGIHYKIHPAIARSFGVTPKDVADTLAGRSEGLVVGQYRGDKDPMPIRLRSPAGIHFSPVALSTANVYGENGRSVPLMQVATPRLVMQPGSIRHYDQRRVARVYSELQPGAVYSQVLNPLRQKIAALSLPPGTQIEYGGNSEESGKANSALFRLAPLGLALLLFFLLIQFNSFVRVGLVLLTAPFALVGVIPGLLLLHIPFGFMPLLGVIALTGIVVNNAIVLIDVVDQCLKEGLPITDAVAEAVRRRTRPIILTTATTIAGLLPLALSGATLWPPMAWPIITGLLASTVLTLLVLPAICCLTLGRTRHRSGPNTARRHGSTKAIFILTLVATASFFAIAPPARAASSTSLGTVSFAQALKLAAHRAEVQRGRHQLDAATANADRIRRAGRYPTLSVSGFVSHSGNVAQLNTRNFTNDVPGLAGTPNQTFNLNNQNQRGADVELRQPIVDIAQQFYGAPAASQNASAAASTLAHLRLTAMVSAANAYVAAMSERARLAANAALITDLKARTKRFKSLQNTGRALTSDVLEIQYSLAEAKQNQADYQRNYQIASARLGQAVGRDTAVAPSSLAFAPPGVDINIDNLVARALSQRRDIVALDHQIHAAKLQTQAIAAERLPTVDAVASLSYNNGSVFLPHHDKRIMAELTWRPFAGGQISARHRAAAASLAALKASRVELTRSIAVAVRKAAADLASMRERKNLMQLGVESAEATRRTRSARLEAGRANLSDVLESDTQLAKRRAAAKTSDYNLVAAWVRLQGAMGDDRALGRLILKAK
ncbi:MAG: efflux RND transporter permease subunit [Salinisphaera sp.]|nr:efflux RND transporter permease subunit [Salinisphaera sp.]